MPQAATKQHEVLLAEFTALKAEIRQGIQMQWNAIALQLTATAVVFSFSLSASSRVGFLLILPGVSAALGSQYLRVALNLQYLGSYIMRELSPKVSNGLNWELWRRRQSPVDYKGLFGFSVPLPLVFPAVSLAALAWTLPYIVSSSNISTLNRYLLGAIWGFDLIVNVLLAYEINSKRHLYYKLRSP
jgi:hypothetical protein